MPLLTTISALLSSLTAPTPSSESGPQSQCPSPAVQVAIRTFGPYQRGAYARLQSPTDIVVEFGAEFWFLHQDIVCPQSTFLTAACAVHYPVGGRLDNATSMKVFLRWDKDDCPFSRDELNAFFASLYVLPAEQKKMDGPGWFLEQLKLWPVQVHFGAEDRAEQRLGRFVLGAHTAWSRLALAASDSQEEVNALAGGFVDAVRWAYAHDMTKASPDLRLACVEALNHAGAMPILRTAVFRDFLRDEPALLADLLSRIDQRR